MLRRLSLGLLVLACAFAVTSAVTAPNTPPDGSSGAHPYCLLTELQFTDGLRIIGDFKPNVFNYMCSCEELASPFSTRVMLRLMDPGSTAEIFFNGAAIHDRTQNNALSMDGNAPNSPRLALNGSDPLQFRPGMNEIVIGAACNLRAQPSPCYYEYTIRCEMPDDGGFIVGDPQFVGLRGQQYQVHGVSGEIYNIVSDSDLQYNSRFVFLDQGECPVVDGKKQKGCFSHPGSYLGEIGIKTRAGDRIHLQTGSAKQGFAAVSVNGRELGLDEHIVLADDLGTVSRNSTHLATVSVGNWEFAFENSDMFVNQRVRVRDARKLRSHGLLGQTWRETTYPNSIKYIAGVVDDYVIREKDIFGDSFVFNSFN